MRRLWAHILIAVMAFVAVFATMPSLIKGISTNGDHRERREFTFQLTEREERDGEAKPAKLNENSAKEMAKVMEQRLIASGIDSYSIRTSGDNEIEDIVTVNFVADDETQYRQITSYLSFNGSFALMNNQNNVVTDKEFRNGSAYLKDTTVNEYPTVILPIKTDFPEWDLLVKNASENAITEEAESESEEATKYSRIWLIFNYEEYDDYESLNDAGTFAKKTLYYFDFTPGNPDELYYNSDKNSLARICGYQDANGNGIADTNEVRTAFNTADYYLNLFNASALDFEVEVIRGFDDDKIYVQPSSEYLVYNSITGNGIVFNATLTASLAAIIIIALLLVVFYRLGALSAAVTTLLSVLFTVIFMVSTALTYNVIALVGIVVVAATSLFSAIVYLNKLKEDAYKGHTLKKANVEASKKSLLPIVDINIVTIVVGLMSYLLGGTALHSFGALLLFGGLISLILNTLGLKGLMWLPTNATALNNKYSVFGINPDNVPNHMAEEKQRYFGPYADKDFTKKKKPVSFVALGAFVLSLAGVIVMASLNGGQILKSPASKISNSELYVTYKYKDESDAKSKLDEKTLKSELLSVIEIKKNDTEAQPLNDFVASTDYSTFEISSSETIDEKPVNFLTTYYVVKLSKVFDNSTVQARIAGETEYKTLAEVLEQYDEENTSSFKATIKTTVTYVAAQDTDAGKIVLGLSIASVILTLYFMIRYRLSRGLTSLLFPVVSVSVTLGLVALFSALGMVLPSAIHVALPIVMIFSYIFMINIMNKEREMIVEDKSGDNSYEHREELSKQALGIGLTPVLASAVIGIYLLINFFGFGTAVASYVYLLAILGSLVALGLVAVLYMPIANFLYKQFSKVNFEFKPKGNKGKKNNQVKKSAEPEEAIFIGIND